MSDILQRLTNSFSVFIFRILFGLSVLWILIPFVCCHQWGLPLVSEACRKIEAGNSPSL